MNKNIKYKRSKKWLITTIYSHQKQTSKKRGHNLPQYTKKELEKWLFSQENFEELYNNWKNSWYKIYLKPSIDRLNDYKGYYFDNIQLMTWEENNKKGHNDMKNWINNKQNLSILQIDKETNKIIKEFYSIQKAEKVIWIKWGVLNCLKWRSKTSKWFIWKYKT